MSLLMKTLPATEAKAQAAPMQRSDWSPYQDNGGTVMAIAGKDFVVVGGDTRLSDGGYAIHSRGSTKIHSLTDFCVIASSGQQSERTTLWKVLDKSLIEYKFENNKDMSPKAVSQMLSNTLYYRRFFPYYTFNVLAGLHEGRGCVWGYDAVGSFELGPYAVTGSGSALITSILDNQVEFKTQRKNAKDLTLEETVTLFKDAFICAGERDIYTGDKVEYSVITKDGTTTSSFDLRKD